MKPQADDLITIPAAAKAIGVDRRTLGRQVNAGAVRSHDGKVRLAEVLEDRAANIDLSRSERWKGKGASPTDAQDVDDGILVDGKTLSFAEAHALKEHYLALKAQLDYERARGSLADIGDVEAAFCAMSSIIRNNFLGLPSKVTPLLIGLPAPEIYRVLTDEVHEILSQISQTEVIADIERRGKNGK